MMCAIVLGCSGAIAMSLIIRKKQVEKQRRQQVVVITVHKKKTNRLHVAVRLFSNRSQMTSKCGKNKKVEHSAISCSIDYIYRESTVFLIS